MGNASGFDFSSLSEALVLSEERVVQALVQWIQSEGGWTSERAHRVSEQGAHLIRAIRLRAQEGKGETGIETFFQRYGLTSPEGLTLMALAEALLRIPDAKTANELIEDKLAKKEQKGSGFGRGSAQAHDWLGLLTTLSLSLSRSTLYGPLKSVGAPVIRTAVREGIRLLGGHFVLAETIPQALKKAAFVEKTREGRLFFSYDVLGEGARMQADAARYLKGYEDALDFLAKTNWPEAGKPSLSVKLSALHPRYSFSQEDQCVPALVQALSTLCHKAAAAQISVCVDAEEVDRLETSLKILFAVMDDAALSSWSGLGLAVQAYGKRSFPLVQQMIARARARKNRTGQRLQIRLVKGAYWDSEIKRAQVKGLRSYGVFTRKRHTDLSYIACARLLLEARDCVYPMFGTHNAATVAAILDFADGDFSGFEFQRLHGMGLPLFDEVMDKHPSVTLRVYAPVGPYHDLLPYLVRRLLENGANSSFVNKVQDQNIEPWALARDPVAQIVQKGGDLHSQIPLPRDLFVQERRLNSQGIDLDDGPSVSLFLARMEEAEHAREKVCGSIVEGKIYKKTSLSAQIHNPADRHHHIGTSFWADKALVERAFSAGVQGYSEWSVYSAARRSAVLRRIAALFESNRAALCADCVSEAGKTLPDAVAEVREAIDFCEYYAALGESQFNENGQILRSYTGETNKILLQGRGTFVCISPWNFPLAIFTGQVVAALMAGNSVIAKPAEQTPFVASRAVRLMHEAGVPARALQLILGDGRVGEDLISHPNVAGVAFTGSTAVARLINRVLAAKEGPIVPLIAETGGQNAIVADSSALVEQLVDDVLLSSFGSAGQRCSACRVLFVQEEIADKTIAMLRGAMSLLRVGNPRFLHTDIGPVIDEEALSVLQRHKTGLSGIGKILAEGPLPEKLKETGHFFAPLLCEISHLSMLSREVFGPILHVIRYKKEDLQEVIRQINGSGYGLTFGVHTRIEAFARKLEREIKAGNVYVNRSIVGAVVGVQPFGGMGLSGTGPKAGGPHYMARFASEKTITINTTAAGGNASLVMMEE